MALFNKFSFLSVIAYLGFSAGVLNTAEADNLNNNIYSYSLDNGLQIIVQVDPRAPVVMSQMWYQVGSAQEHLGETGLSHFLEHMLFQGSETFPPSDLIKSIASHGGLSNAYTYQDGTVYSDFVPKDQLASVFQLESDRMENLSFGSGQLDQERKVILEERHQLIDDDPMGDATEILNYMTEMASPYATPVIGWQSDIEQLSSDDLYRWHARYYVPNLATLIIVGDVDPNNIYQLATQYFSSIKKAPELSPKNYPIIFQNGVKHILVRRPGSLPTLIMSFRVPSIASAEKAYAQDPTQNPMQDPIQDPSAGFGLVVLADLLANMDSSRFQQDLVRDQNLASYIQINYSPLARLNTSFQIIARPMPGVSLAQLEAAIFTEFEQLAQTPPTDAEIARVITYAESQHLYFLDSPFGEASLLGELNSGAGLDWHLSQNYLTHLQSVNSSELIQLLNQYLSPDNLVDVDLVPINNLNNPANSANSANSSPEINLNNLSNLNKINNFNRGGSQRFSFSNNNLNTNSNLSSNFMGLSESKKISDLNHDPALLNNLAIRDREQVNQVNQDPANSANKLGDFL